MDEPAPSETSELALAGPSWSIGSCDEARADRLGKALGLTPLVARVLSARGVSSEAAARDLLDPRLGSLPSPAGLLGLEAAVERLARAVRTSERVAVFGDYDADGLTAVALSVLVLRGLGLEVQPRIASRFGHGYGLGEEVVDEVAREGRSLLLVLDCGTTDLAAARSARQLGLDVVIVDHHPPGPRLPEATALVNPWQPGCAFPDKGLAAVGLAFYAMGVLRTALGAELDVRELLDLVALGTIADVAPLTGANRALVRRGLELLSTRPRPGLAALRAVCRASGRVTAWTVGFQLAPRINAAGRLGRAEEALELLLVEEPARAALLASRLDELSSRRRTIEEAIMGEAMPEALRQVEQGRSAVVVARQGWSPGVVGIVAARLVERLGVTVAVVALEGESGRGSARAPEGVDLHASLALCGGELERFGGHAGAAGFTVSLERLPRFSEAFSEAVSACRAGGPEAGLRLATEICPSDLALAAADELERLGPFGADNPEPLFLLRSGRILRLDERRGGHLSLLVDHGGVRARGFAPRMAERWPRDARRLDLAVGLRRDDYRTACVELRVAGFRPPS